MTERARFEIVWNESDPEYWDPETGKLGKTLFANTVQVWHILQNYHPGPSVAETARAFNCRPERIIEAVEDHPWMFLTGPSDDFDKMMIEHEGE